MPRSKTTLGQDQPDERAYMHLGSALRAMFNDAVSEELPDGMRLLLEQLDSKQSALPDKERDDH
jgi:hypothetical protein